MENAKKFFEQTIKTEAAKALIASYERPKTEKACIEAYVDIAEKLGETLTYEGVAAYLADIGELRQGELDDEELEQLSGGMEITACADTFKQGINCWLSDGRNYIIKRNNSSVCGSTSANNPYGTEKRINNNDSCTSTIVFSRSL